MLSYAYILVETVSLLSFLCGITPDIINFTLMNIQIYLAMKGVYNMRVNNLGVVITCICGVV